tara:strand:+ start:1126 stop:1686 length:561 start_codon:yes stop_codon:yes gene_type:complete
MTQKLTENLKIAIRDEFVHGFTDAQAVRQYPTIDFLVKKHGVSRPTLYSYSSDENWQGQKNKVQTEIQTAIDDDRIKRIVSDAKRLDDTSVQIAQAMLTRVGRRLQKAFDAEDLNPEILGIDASELREMSVIAGNAQKIGKLALGQAQEISKVSADVSNPEAFHRVMEQLDELANARSQGGSKPLH